MDISATILLFLGMLLVAVFLERIAEVIRLPFALLLIVLGWLGSQLIGIWGIDTGLRWDNIYDLVYYVFLPIIIFEAAVNLDSRVLIRNLIPILFLAVPVMLLTALMIAVLVYYGIGHPEGFPWIAALLTGALLSSTDPVSVMSVFKRFSVPERLRLLLEGESLFNDAASVALFVIVLTVATSSSEADLSTGALAFVRLFGGGVILGLLAIPAAYWLFPYIDSKIHLSIASLFFVYATFLVSEYLHVSGVIAVLVFGVGMNHIAQSRVNTQARGFMLKLWSYKSWIANALLFLIAGITIQLSMFTDQWLAMLIAIAGALLARAVGIYTIFPLSRYIPSSEPVKSSYHGIIFWGGVRGSIVMALALSLPLTLPYWWTVQSMAYGVVIFTLLVQAPTMPWVIRQALKND